MRQRNFRSSLLGLMALLVLICSLALVGCDDDGGGDDLEATDLAGRTFTFTGLGALNSNLANQPATLVFGPAVTGDDLPFTLTTSGNTFEGVATVTSIEFLISRINGSSTSGTSVTLDGDPDDVTITVGDILEVDAEIQREDDADTITFINPDTGDSIDFVFPPDATGATGSTGDS